MLSRLWQTNRAGALARVVARLLTAALRPVGVPGAIGCSTGSCVLLAERVAFLTGD